MADVNTVVLVGRLVRDAELKYTNSGLAICEFAVAINNRRKQGDEWVEEAHFFDVTLFGRQGEAIQRFMTKGKQVGIEGSLRQDRWQDRESGQNRSKVVVIANNVMLLGGRDDAGGGGGGGSYRGGGGGAPSGGGQRGGQSGAPQRESGGGEFEDDFPDGIPF